MRTKEEIMEESAKGQLWDSEECANSFRYSILEALLDIRDILNNQINVNVRKEETKNEN